MDGDIIEKIKREGINKEEEISGLVFSLYLPSTIFLQNLPVLESPFMADRARP